MALFRNAKELLEMEATQAVLGTGIPEIDFVLGGENGLLRGGITELVGNAGAGKSQICQQILSHTLRSRHKAFCIDTEGSFRTNRLVQMLGGDCNSFLLKNLLHERPLDYEALLAALRNIYTGLESKRLAIELLVVDSVAYGVKGLNKDEYRLAIDSIGRELCKLSSLGIAILLTNHVVDEIVEGTDTSFVRAALPAWWAQRVTCRLWVERVSPAGSLRRLSLVKSPCRPRSSAEFIIQSDGLAATAERKKGREFH
ncbi:unnamed protein product, partial [Mesorhabditis spiculigera]